MSIKISVKNNINGTNLLITFGKFSSEKFK